MKEKGKSVGKILKTDLMRNSVIMSQEKLSMGNETSPNKQLTDWTIS